MSERNRRRRHRRSLEKGDQILIEDSFGACVALRLKGDRARLRLDLPSIPFDMYPNEIDQLIDALAAAKTALEATRERSSRAIGEDETP